MSLEILVIQNNLNAKKDLERVFKWLENKLEININISYLDLKLDVSLKNLGLFPYVGVLNSNKDLYGLNNVKEKIKPFIQFANYHIIIFLYDFDLFINNEKIEDKNSWGAFTHSNLFQNSAFIESPFGTKLYPDLIYRILTHELCHALHRIAWQKGINTKDDMDLYDYEFDVETTNGNRQRNINRILPHISKITELPLFRKLAELKEQLRILLEKYNGMSLLEKLANGIKEHEGWFEGSRSYRNNNPGNIRYTKYTASLGAIGKDDKNFCIFPDYFTGFNALIQFLKDAFGRKLLPYYKFNKGISYHRVLLPNGSDGDLLPNLTLYDFTSIYAPRDDNNDSYGYATRLSNYCKVPITIKVKDFLL